MHKMRISGDSILRLQLDLIHSSEPRMEEERKEPLAFLRCDQPWLYDQRGRKGSVQPALSFPKAPSTYVMQAYWRNPDLISAGARWLILSSWLRRCTPRKSIPGRAHALNSSMLSTPVASVVRHNSGSLRSCPPQHRFRDWHGMKDLPWGYACLAKSSSWRPITCQAKRQDAGKGGLEGYRYVHMRWSLGAKRSSWRHDASPNHVPWPNRGLLVSTGVRHGGAEATPGTRSTRDTQNRTTPRPLPLPPHSLDLFRKLTADESYRVVQYMDLAVVVDFAMQLPRTMGYVGRTAACSHPLFPLHYRRHRVWHQDSW